jgi:hypothetical protein
MHITMHIQMHSTMAITLRHNPWTISLQVAKHVFRNALAWCSQHKNDPAPSQSDDADSRSKTTEIEGWDHKFMQFDRNMLFQTILAMVSGLSSPIPTSLS